MEHHNDNSKEKHIDESKFDFYERQLSHRGSQSHIVFVSVQENLVGEVEIAEQK